MTALVKKPSALRYDEEAALKLISNSEKIKNTWLKSVREEMTVMKGHGDLALLDSIPTLLKLLEQGLRTGTFEESEVEKTICFTKRAEQRVQWADFSLEQATLELQILGRAIFDCLNAEEALTYPQSRLVQNFIDQGIRITTTRFTQIQRFHEKLEMQYLKLIEKFVMEVSDVDSVLKSLQRLLKIVLDGMRAEAAAILLYRNDTSELNLSVAAGSSESLAEKYRTALAFSSFAIQASRSAKNVSVSSVDSFGPDLKSAFGTFSIKTVLTLKLHSREEEVGILCIGFKDNRPFDEVELRLLEVLSDRLSLLLGNVRIYDQSKHALEKIRHEHEELESQKEEIRIEQKKRDEFVSAIAHDLRNPLTSAKMSAELISRSATKTPQATETLASQIVKSINRTDRMIHDLLDSNRIRAGKRLPMKIEPYDMTELVQEIISDFKPTYGDRFVFNPHGRCPGFWSREDMRRAVENLLTNAVKHGADDHPIKISVNKVESKMVLSVHNEGTPIAPSEQKRIFEPFTQSHNTKSSQTKGWGIGLTLVRGIVDAHGGTVKVTSTPEGGTTFTIINPMDSRPYQEEEG